MLERLIHLLQRAGYYLSRMNEQFYFYVDIETSIPWAIILLMYFLYKLLDKYFHDKVLSSDELIRLILIYLAVLLVIVASYTDLKNLLNDPDRDSSFVLFVVLIIGLIITIARLGVSTDAQKKKRWILVALYAPIVWIILTNGRALEERIDTLSGLLPRSNNTFIGLQGEFDKLVLGGQISEKQMLRVQTIIEEFPAVRQSAVIGRKDVDDMIKPYGLVVLNEGYSANDPGLSEDIIDFVYDRIQDEAALQIDAVKPISREKLPRRDKRFASIESILRSHPAVIDGVVIEERDRIENRTRYVAYVILNPDSERPEPEEDILFYVNREIGEVKLSDYFYPRWIDFVPKDYIPRTSDDRVDYEKLQKKRANWSEAFRAIGDQRSLE